MRGKASATATATREGTASSLTSACLYLVLECRRPAAGGEAWRLEGLDEVQLGRGDRRSSERDEGAKKLSIQVADGRMSTQHARLARLAGGWAFEDLGSKNGSRVLGVPAKFAELKSGDTFELGETLFLYREELELPEATRRAKDHASSLPTLSPSLQRAYDELDDVARADVAVLLLGETGTGKEVAARAIHERSGRKGRFVAVNCGALPKDLIEAELFGHRQGAFSGALEARPGLIRAADRGTLFLDEIGDLPLSSQAALLRVLQEKEVTGVGETTPTRVDVRIIAATHHDLRARSEEGKFRLDLLARIDGYASRMPPLRERRCDLGLLIARLIERIAPDRASRITLQPQAARALLAYDWPTNIRELEQAMRAALAITRDDVITLANLPERLRDEPSPTSAGPSSKRPAPPREALSPEDEALKAQLTALLTEHRGSINGVSRAMNKDRTQIKRWLTRLCIDAEEFRG